jgi:protein-L-isoaspartate(D-aspartate) O-methyltransferase
MPPEVFTDPFAALRTHMVASQIEARGVRDPAVLAAMRRVPRHLFVPPALTESAYRDEPLAVGFGQTISQPYIVALMTELIRPHPAMRVLEIGTGSGYQTAVLALCVGEVHSIEIVPELSERARMLLARLGIRNLQLRVGDGHDGWPDAAPFDAILAAAAPATIPRALLGQLAMGGRLVMPVGEGSQELVRVTRGGGGDEVERVIPVRFVPMVGGEEKDGESRN